MKVSLNWLKDYVDIDIETNQLVDLYNLHSAEVENTYKLVDGTKLVIGYVSEKTPHPDADKLSVCQVDIGSETTQIVCGAPNVDQGQTVIVSLPGAVLPGGFKIKKSTIRGIESNGMICSLSELGIDKKFHNEDGIHVIEEQHKPGTDALEALHLNDEVIALDLTPNRADMLSMMGVAYDTAAILNKPVHLPTPVVEECEDVCDVTVKIDTPNCESYYTRIIGDLEIKQSPKWMQSRLIAAGMRPINNVVDIANYVMLETGQPLHTFDYDLLQSKEIVVRMANEGETLQTLDEQQRVLTSDDIVITNGKEAVALGGVMGGFSTEIHDKTSRLLLESATFSPVHIRKTSTRLDLRSEASMRFERQVNPENTLYALERATELFAKYANGKPYKGVSKVDNVDYSRPIIEVAISKINQYLGSNYSEEIIADAAKRLQYDYHITDSVLFVQSPWRKVDLLTYQDLIEELGRIIGYDSLPTTLPDTISTGHLNAYQQFERQIRRILTGFGLYEAVTYALVDQERNYDFAEEFVGPPVPLQMPLSMDKNVLTFTPLLGLLDVVKYNMARKNTDLFLFELGKRYELKEDPETKLLVGAMTGLLSSTNWQQKREVVDFFTVKGILSSLFEQLGLAHLEFTANVYKNFHPGQSAVISDPYRGTIVGRIGKLHPRYEKENGIKNVFVFELQMEKLFELAKPVSKVKEINKFPIVYRDLALVMDETMTAKQVLNCIKKAGKRTLQDISIFDEYRGENILPTQKSLAIRLAFSDFSKTLEAKEVDDITNRILTSLEKELNVTLR